ncbi:MAG: glycosyltransferase family 2 protein [Chloroflexi bacterium]|nr:glycosyltransferase family 2 protein [Chloroflexota bacterium]
MTESGHPNFPRVSLLIPMCNEAGYIEHCLASIFAQDYPNDRLEILVLDGQSTDGSWRIVERLFQEHPNCHLLPNPKITQAAGWNLGIQASHGDIIGIVSAHAELAPDYVSTAVETLLRTGADMVGGPMRAVSDGLVGQAIALATSTFFGIGGGRFHYTDREEEVDTVYMGLCWRELYERIGGFDEEMVRNQDDELSYRLLKHGGRIVCNPAIRSRYYNRSTLSGLWRQYFHYGVWKVRVLQKHPRQMRLTQFAPPALAAALLGFTLLGPTTRLGQLLLALVVASYIVANLAASLWIARKQDWRHPLLLSVAFAVIHLSYGPGFLIGLARFAHRWRDR